MLAAFVCVCVNFAWIPQPNIAISANGTHIALVHLLQMNGGHVILPSVFVSKLLRTIRTFELRFYAARVHQVFLEAAFALGALVRATATVRTERRVLYGGLV